LCPPKTKREMNILSVSVSSDPLDIGRISPIPGKKIYGIMIKANNMRDTIDGLYEAAEEGGIKIRYVQFLMPKSKDEDLRAVAFLDFTNAEISSEQALEILKNRAIKDLRLIKPGETDVVLDMYFFPLKMGKERAVIFGRWLYKGLLVGIREQFGSAGEAFLYYAGYNAGKNAYELSAKLVREGEIETMGKMMKALSLMLGWAVIKKAEINSKRKIAYLRLYDNFECELGKGSQKPYSRFIRGFVAGFFSCLFGEEVEVEETKCIAKGDEHCEFKVKKI